MNEDSMPAQEGSKMPSILAVVGIIVVVGIIIFVMSQNSNAPEQPLPPANGGVRVLPGDAEEATDEAAMEEETMEDSDEAEPGVVEIEMEAGSFYFDPDEITVNLGDTVRITLNAVDMQHDFVLDEFDVQSETISSGETTEIEFVADQVGEFEYYCSVGNHRALGMTGTLIVEE